MSFFCHARNDIVIGQKMVLVPIAIRKVYYTALKEQSRDSDYGEFVLGRTEGWEVAEEVPVARDAAAQFAESHPPEIVMTKEVKFIVPKKQRPTRKHHSRSHSEQ